MRILPIVSGLAFFLLCSTSAFAQQNKSANKAKSTAKYAALAIDRDNGFFYGWSYDHPSRQVAEAEALDGATKYGAKSPSIVLVWSGEGCGAYRTVANDVGSAYGWGVARTKEAADRIATSEASKRSDGRPVPNHVWACNSKSAPVKVVYDASPEIFKTVAINGQTWTAESLQVTKFRNGDPISKARTPEEFQKITKEKKPAYLCYTEQSCAKYGKIYNAHAALDPRGLAPAGWRIPSKADWEKLINGLGGKSAAGPKMRSSEGWPSWAVPGSNSSGFNAMAVNRFVGSKDDWQKESPTSVSFWSSTVLEEGKYIHHTILRAYGSRDEVFVGNQSYYDGLYVRMIKE